MTEQQALDVSAPSARPTERDEDTASWVDPYWLIVSSAPIALFEVDGDARIARSNPAFVQLVGSKKGGGAVSLEVVLGPEQWADLHTAVESRGTVRDFRATLERVDGIAIPVEIAATGVRLPSSETRIIGSIRDMSHQHAAEERLRQEATRDALTGLPHRGALVEDLELQLTRLRRAPDRSFGVGFLDLDDFKRLNDTAGHLVGDQVLVAISNRLKNGLRPDDRAYRYGGDEFVIIFGDVDGPETAAAVGRRLLELISQPCRIGDQVMRVGGSLGICLCQDATLGPQELLRSADTAMSSAKRSGPGTEARIVAC